MSSLPVLGSKIRKSPAGKWRAAVLIGVHVLIALHVAHWLATGSTLTPLEPSEAMEFAKRGVVNAGLIFFAMATVSTLVFGRWLCGWGCHLIAVQDLSRWILGKLGIRPKPARIGLLAAVPLIAFLYMFVAPALYRALHGYQQHQPSTHYTTETFWATFPPLIPAVLTLLTCGFVVIYLLGSKGFCTYGCPYGAAFGVADQLAPLSIRVTDACRGCGHCTAVCSSNVRVHQEVRDHGMVVDPGCMKTFDCVSVCPNEALYFGAGRPAIIARRPMANSAAIRAGLPAALQRWLLLGLFAFAAFSLFMWFDDEFDWRMSAILTAAVLAVAAIFKGKSQRRPGYSQPEEALLGLFFLLSMLVFRGLYGAVPFLFALGLSGMSAYLAVELVRLAYKPNLSLHRFQLKRGGRLAPAGAIFALLVLGWGAFGAHGATVQYRRRLVPRLATHHYRRGVEAALDNHLDRAADSFERALLLRPDFIEARENLAGVYCATGRHEEGIVQYRKALQQNPEDSDTCLLLAIAYVETRQLELAVQQLERAVELAPGAPEPRVLLARIRALLGSPPDASKQRGE